MDVLHLNKYRIAGYLHGKLFSRTCQNSLQTEMLTEEKFAKRAMALIMVMFVCAYNISAMCTWESFSIASMVRGYHKYKDIWVATEGEQLLCRRENDNIHDLFSVAVIKNDYVVGHVPKKISTTCSLFLRRGGTIMCTINGSRRYSQDLPQGGLEIPCELLFTGNTKYIEKAKHCLSLAGVSVDSNAKDISTSTEMRSVVSDEPKVKKSPTKVIHLTDTTESNSEQSVPIWMKIGRITLQEEHKEMILKGSMLNDVIINAAQFLLKEQFPDIFGFQSTLLLEKPPARYEQDKVHVQIIFDRDNHWITTSNAFAKKGEILVYDSMYTRIDKNTKTIMTNLFGQSTTARLVGSSKQAGGTDCGLFAIANATALAFKINPTDIMFEQSTLLQHLVSCMEEEKFTLFPMI